MLSIADNFTDGSVYLGDGLASWIFCDTFNRNYLGTHPRFTPTYDSYLSALPKLEPLEILDDLPLMPHAAIDYTPEEFFRMYTTMRETTSRVDIQFTKSEVEAMRLTAQQRANVKIGIKDALAAYLITVLSRVDDLPITTFQNVLSVSPI